MKANDHGRVLDPLTITLVLGTRLRDRVHSRIRVENNSGHVVSNAGCRVGSNYSWGVVPVSKPDKSVSRRVLSTGCAQPRDLPDGFVDTFKGPTFFLTEGPRIAPRSLRPGDYLATIDFGDARSERLTAKITIDNTVLTGR